jgi:alkylation response protein AidB-like acyl-CoA dehydrogenase
VADFNEQLTTLVERLANDAARVDQADVLPTTQLDALADIGLYGVFAPEPFGGLGLGVHELCSVVEALASGCLATTFVWIQHFRLLAAVLDPAANSTLVAMRSQVISGDIKGGVVLTGALPGPSRLTAAPTADGWTLHGTAPWVSGWGLVDELCVAARGPDETVVNVLIEPRAQDGLTITRHAMTAINATSTVALTFDSLTIDNSRVVSRIAYDQQQETGPGLRVNGSLALGVTRRCCSMIGSPRLDVELSEARTFLDDADGDAMPKARARASELAARAAGALCVHRGSTSVLRGDVAERTSREATLLLAFGSRPAIREALLEYLIA